MVWFRAASDETFPTPHFSILTEPSSCCWSVLALKVSARGVCDNPDAFGASKAGALPRSGDCQPREVLVATPHGTVRGKTASSTGPLSTKEHIIGANPCAFFGVRAIFIVFFLWEGGEWYSRLRRSVGNHTLTEAGSVGSILALKTLHTEPGIGMLSL